MGNDTESIIKQKVLYRISPVEIEKNFSTTVIRKFYTDGMALKYNFLKKNTYSIHSQTYKLPGEILIFINYYC